MTGNENFAWEIKKNNHTIGHANSYDAAREIGYPHDSLGKLLDENGYFGAINISPMLTEFANNYFTDLAKDFLGDDANYIDGCALIRCGRWLDKHFFITVDKSGKIFADDIYVGEVFLDDFGRTEYECECKSF